MTESSQFGLASMSRSPARDEHEHKTQDLGRAGFLRWRWRPLLGAAPKTSWLAMSQLRSFPHSRAHDTAILPLLPLFVIVPYIDFWHARQDWNNFYAQQRLSNRVSSSHTARLALCPFSPRGNATPFPLQHSILLYQDQDSGKPTNRRNRVPLRKRLSDGIVRFARENLSNIQAFGEL